MKCRTVKRRPESLRWDRVRVDAHESVFLVIVRSVTLHYMGLHQEVWRDAQLQGLCG